MHRVRFHKAVGGLLAIAFSGFTALAMAQGAATTAQPGDDSANDSPDGGTIQWGPPGPPEQAPAGAQGPVRSDTGLSSDPSIRDTDPLTANGPWEQLPGNRIVNRALEQQQSAQPQQQPQQ
jgi:hypothetical protein